MALGKYQITLLDDRGKWGSTTCTQSLCKAGITDSLTSNLSTASKTDISEICSIRLYLEVFDQFLASNLSAINFLHNKVSCSKKRWHKVLNERLKIFIDVWKTKQQKIMTYSSATHKLVWLISTWFPATLTGTQCGTVIFRYPPSPTARCKTALS